MMFIVKNKCGNKRLLQEDTTQQRSTSIHLIYRSSIVKLLDSEEVTLEQVQALDERVLEWCNKAREDPFYPGASVL